MAARPRGRRAGRTPSPPARRRRPRGCPRARRRPWRRPRRAAPPRRGRTPRTPRAPRRGRPGSRRARRTARAPRRAWPGRRGPCRRTASPPPTPGPSSRDLGRPPGESRNQLGGALGLVDRHVGVAVLDELEAGVREGRGQALGVTQLEEAIVGRPRDQDRLVELAEAPRGLLGV